MIELNACYLTYRKRGNVIYHIVEKYQNLEFLELIKLEQFALKFNKFQLETKFLKNCAFFKVIPNLIYIVLLNIMAKDRRCIQKDL